jgi:O-antigen ligase
MPFDQIILPWLPGFLSPARISGVVFFGCCLWYPKTCLRRAPPAVLWFAGYLAVVALLGMFVPAELRGQVLIRFLTMTQLVIFFWVGSSVLQDIRLARQSLVTFGAAAAALAVGTLLQVPGLTVSNRTGEFSGATRTTALDFNPNTLASLMSVAAVMLIGTMLDNTKRRKWMTWLLTGMVAPLILVIVQTGSRGGLLEFVIGVSLFLVPMAPSRRRIAAFALGSFALIALGVMIARDPVSLVRWTQTISEGRIAGRDAIWNEGIHMFLERPILGWGPVDFLYELGSRLSLPARDPHQGILWLLLEVGIVGALFFFVGFYLCARASWKSRTGPEGILPLALMVMAVAMNLVGTPLARKHFWFVLALALASPVVSAKWQRAVPRGNRGSWGRL